jgi:DNA-binding transcriptional LysR family regulator
MELQQLRYAVAVADEGSFTAAARACFIAQPSLSQAVKTLERELGAALFHRLGRRVILTAAGEAFVPAARETLRALDTVRAGVAAVAGLVAGRLDLVALPTLAVDPVAPLVGRFRRDHPQVLVRLLQPDDVAGVVADVRSGAAELALTEAALAGERLVVHALGPQDVVAVLPPGSRRPRRALGVDRLAELPLVTLARGTSTRHLLDDALAAVGATPTIAVETDQREALVPLVLAGAGATIVPRAMAETARRLGAVVTPLDPPITRALALVHRAAPLSPAAAAFVAVAIESSSPTSASLPAATESSSPTSASLPAAIESSSPTSASLPVAIESSSRTSASLPAAPSR